MSETQAAGRRQHRLQATEAQRQPARFALEADDSPATRAADHRQRVFIEKNDVGAALEQLRLDRHPAARLAAIERPGGPTHAHGLTSTASRKSAVEAAEKDEDLDVDPDAEGPGLRDWLSDLTRREGQVAAAFDTRVDAPAALTGRASKGIARRLKHHHYDLVSDPESFLVDKHSLLLAGEADRAEAWGSQIARAAQAAQVDARR